MQRTTFSNLALLSRNASACAETDQVVQIRTILSQEPKKFLSWQGYDQICEWTDGINKDIHQQKRVFKVISAHTSFTADHS